MIPHAIASRHPGARVSPRRRIAYVAAAVAFAGALLLISPLHLAGAITLTLGVALFCFAEPIAGLWLVLVLSAIHPIVAKIVQVDIGATGSALVVFSAWKEVGLAAVVLADLEILAREFMKGRRWQMQPALMDVMAGAMVALVAFGLALRHDLMAVNEARLLLFPIGVYFALRLAPVGTVRYFKVMVVVATGIAVLGVIQSSLLGWPFITTYWGTPTDPLPITFAAQGIDGPRASATFGSPNELGFALIAWSLMSCALLLVRPRNDRWLIPALAVILVGLALTFSRSAVGAAGLGMIIVFLAAWRLSPSPRRAMAALALGLVPAVLVSGVIYAARGGGDLISLTADTFLYGASSATKTVTLDIHSWVVGQPEVVTVTIKDVHGSPDSSYRGTIHFTTSDPNATLPADYTFTAADAGTHTFDEEAKPPLELVSVGRQWVRVTDTSDANVTGQMIGTFTYPPSTTLHVEVGSWVAGKESAVTVTAEDAQGRRWAGYRGTIHFTSSDPKASLPGDYTFKTADAGSHTFRVDELPPLIFGSMGDQWVRATDKMEPSLTAVASGTVVPLSEAPSSPASTKTMAPTPPPPSPTPGPSVAPTPAASTETEATITPPPSPVSVSTITPAPGSTPEIVPGYVSPADASAAAHLKSLGQGWDLLEANPLGTGLGTVGPRPLPGTTDFPAYVIESYYLAMGVSLGWLGFVWAIALPLTMLFLAIRTTRRGHILEGSCLLAIALATAVVGFVLPTMMEPQMAMIPWSVCALATSSLTGEGSPKAPAPKRATP